MFLTGISGLNQPTGVTASEMLRLNTSIAPVARDSQNRLGALGGDIAGFPNGRRPGDDVVDIELRVAMGALCHAFPGAFGCGPADAPSGTLAFTDGAFLEDRAVRKESQMPGREQFSRSVKSLLRAGPTDTAQGFDRVLGLPLEFVLEAPPPAFPDGHLPLRLLFDERPLERALVVAYRRNAGAHGEGTGAFRGRTDAAGRVVLPIAGGQWLVKAVHMQRAEPGSNADWHSVWTALTFELPASR